MSLLKIMVKRKQTFR